MGGPAEQDYPPAADRLPHARPPAGVPHIDSPRRHPPRGAFSFQAPLTAASIRFRTSAMRSSSPMPSAAASWLATVATSHAISMAMRRSSAHSA
jgi:hypothetical protein